VSHRRIQQLGRKILAVEDVGDTGFQEAKEHIHRYPPVKPEAREPPEADPAVNLAH